MERTFSALILRRADPDGEAAVAGVAFWGVSLS